MMAQSDTADVGTRLTDAVCALAFGGSAIVVELAVPKLRVPSREVRVHRRLTTRCIESEFDMAAETCSVVDFATR